MWKQILSTHTVCRVVLKKCTRLLLESTPQIIQYNPHLPNIPLTTIRSSHMPQLTKHTQPPQFEEINRHVDKNILGKSGKNNTSLYVSVSCLSAITLVFLLSKDNSHKFARHKRQTFIASDYIITFICHVHSYYSSASPVLSAFL